MNKKIFVVLFALPLLFSCGSTPKEETELKITTQPTASQDISFPDGFSLSVEVNNEKLVKSYQWQIDSGTTTTSWRNLDCSSGRSKTLTKMSTNSNTKNKRYRCVITDQNDNSIYSDEAWVNVTNSRTYKSVINFAGYAINAGETFDLSKTNLGTGTIEYDTNGYEVTLHNVNFENSNPVYDYYDSTPGFNVTNYDSPYSSFIINVDGNNNFTNNFWQEDQNAGAIIFTFNFLGDSQMENVVFQGDGSLSLEGGTHLIYANTKVDIDCNMVFNKIGTRYATGVYANEIEIKEDVNITASLNGFLFQTKKGALKIDNGATINCVATVPHVAVGSTDFHLISAMSDLTLDGCNLNYIINCDKNVFSSGQGVGQVVGLLAHKGNLTIKNSKITSQFVSNNPTKAIGYNQKFLLAEEGNAVIDNSKLESSCDDSKYENASGIFARKDITITNSSLDLTIKASGSIEGISTNGNLNLDNSTLNINYGSYDEDATSRGIIACGFTLTNNSSTTINSTSGIAILVQVGAGDEEKGYDESYVPSVLDKANIISPTSYAINQYSLEGSTHNYVYMETIYAGGSKTLPSASCYLTSINN